MITRQAFDRCLYYKLEGEHVKVERSRARPKGLHIKIDRSPEGNRGGGDSPSLLERTNKVYLMNALSEVLSKINFRNHWKYQKYRNISIIYVVQ